MMCIGCGQDLSRLKVRLEDAVAGKSIAEDINVSLQVLLMSFENFNLCLNNLFCH